MRSTTSVDRTALPIVLLVFDCPTTQSFLELALVDDAAVVTTHDPEVAARLADRVDVAVMIVDLDRARAGAGSLLAELRASAVGATILELASADEADGARGVIPKPVDRGQLLRAVVDALERRAAARRAYGAAADAA